MLHPSNIIRSKRKTLALYVDPNGELIVKAPMRLSEARIFAFVKTKEEWIRTQQERIARNSYINRSVVSYNTFYFLGQEITPVTATKVKKITLNGGILYIPTKLTEKGSVPVTKKVEKWLKAQAKIIAQERAIYFSGRLRLNHTEIKVNNNKTRWGVCSKDGKIAINWRAVMLEPRLFDYIMVHEFCHLLEFNHSKQFWHLVEAVLPNWRALRKDLKKMNWLLSLFRV